jgi:hypothetical protein
MKYLSYIGKICTAVFVMCLVSACAEMMGPLPQNQAPNSTAWVPDSSTPVADKAPASVVDFKMHDMDKTMRLKVTNTFGMQIPLSASKESLVDRGFNPPVRGECPDLVINVNVSPLCIKNSKKEAAQNNAIAGSVVLGVLTMGMVGVGQNGQPTLGITDLGQDTNDHLAVIEIEFASVQGGTGHATSTVDISKVPLINVPGVIDDEVVRVLEQTM